MARAFPGGESSYYARVTEQKARPFRAACTMTAVDAEALQRTIGGLNAPGSIFTVGGNTFNLVFTPQSGGALLIELMEK